MLTPYMAVIGKRHIVQSYRHWQRRKTLRTANRLFSVSFSVFLRKYTRAFVKRELPCYNVCKGGQRMP